MKTPLLLPDAARSHEHKEDNAALGVKKGHKDFPARLDADGQPLVPPTSIKGMLRSAYEAVTNSRLTVFAGHEDRLADRMPAREGLALVPARIVAVNGTEMIELLPGNSGISGSGRPTDNDPMYAAWLPRYNRQTGQVAHFAARYPDNGLPQHPDAVEVWLELWERTGQHPFAYWSVRKCVRLGQSLGNQPQPGQRRGAHQPVQDTDMISVRGYVCVTNRNIDRKHDERVFFTTRDKPVLHPLTDGLRQQWCELITNYQTIHQAERDAGMTSPPALNNSIWSRQVVGGADERDLTEGTLCHAAFRDYGAENVILNPTGGFKALVPYTVLVGMLKRVPCRYIFEQSAQLLDLPPLPVTFDRALFERYRSLIERIERETAILRTVWEREVRYDDRPLLEPMVEQSGHEITISGVGLLFLDEIRSPTALVPFLSRTAWNDCLDNLCKLKDCDPFRYLHRVAGDRKQFRLAEHINVGNGLLWLKPGRTTDRYLVSIEDWRMLVWRAIREDEVGSDYVARVTIDPASGRRRYEPVSRMEFSNEQF